MVSFGIIWRGTKTDGTKTDRLQIKYDLTIFSLAMKYIIYISTYWQTITFDAVQLKLDSTLTLDLVKVDGWGQDIF